jgi:hypothetical protein
MNRTSIIRSFIGRIEGNNKGLGPQLRSFRPIYMNAGPAEYEAVLITGFCEMESSNMIWAVPGTQP